MARTARAARLKVVDFSAYRARLARTPAAFEGPALPLFDGQPAPAEPPAAPGGRADRRLSDREVEHRERMLAFLRASADQ